LEYFKHDIPYREGRVESIISNGLGAIPKNVSRAVMKNLLNNKTKVALRFLRANKEGSKRRGSGKFLWWGVEEWVKDTPLSSEGLEVHWL